MRFRLLFILILSFSVTAAFADGSKTTSSSDSKTTSSSDSKSSSSTDTKKAAAENTATTQTKPMWSGNAQLGGVINTGNAPNKNGNGKLTLNFNKNKWENTATASGQIASSDKQLTGSRYELNGETNYFFQPRQFLFANGNGVWDRFSSYSYVATFAAGVGWRLINLNSFYWDVQFGPGYRMNKIEATNDKTEEFIMQGTSTMNWQITKASSLQQVVTTDIGYFSHRYSFIKTVTSLNTNIIGNLGLNISFTTNYNSSIPPESKNRFRLDTITSVALVYGF